MSVFAIIHLLAAVITEYTVNNRNLVPEAFNYIWHIIFLVSVTFVCAALLDYLLYYVERGSGIRQRLQRTILLAVCGLAIVGEIVLPIEYVDTPYGSYSLGMKAYCLYGAVVYSIVMMIVLLVRYRAVIGKDRSRVMIASILIFITMSSIQMLYPYVLLTGLGVTMIILGIMINTEDAHIYISYATDLCNELGCAEILQELLLQKKPLHIGVYAFLGEYSDIKDAMLSVREALNEKKQRVICGTLADNILVVLPIYGVVKGITQIDTLPEPVSQNDKLNYKKEIMEFSGQKSVSDIVEYINDFKTRYEGDALQRDDLTGLLRRTAFIRQIDYMIASKIGFTFVMLDLDDFKSINNTYGHNIGDVALKYVANALSTALRKADVICRIGGDEFAVALSGVTDPAIIFETTERVKKQLAKQDILPDDRCVLRVSFGAKIYNPEGGTPSFNELYEEADAALYRAKHQGKNRLVVAD